jgi:hypothetical protein
MTNQLQEHSDVRRAAAVAADHTQLQGLINVTTGIGLVVWALGWPSWGGAVIGIGGAVWATGYRLGYRHVGVTWAHRAASCCWC